MRKHMHRIVALALVGALLTVPTAAHAVGELNGRISGVITAKETGAALGGVDIRVAGPALIGGPRTLVSNDDGTYEVIELPPGVYDVEVGFPGTIKTRRRIEVRQGQTSPLSIAWSPQFEEVQTYNVVEERHPTNPDSAQVGVVLTKDQQAKIASARNYQGLAQQVAGAVDINGAGNYQIKGGNLGMNRYMVDGLDITDPVTNTFSSNINFDSVASEEILTGGFEAEYNSLGGIINLITTGGSDRLQIDSSFYINNNKFSAANQYGSSLYDGVRQFSNNFTPPTTSGYQANLNVSGPLLKHRLWFSLSFEYDHTERSIVMGPPLNVQHPPRTFDGFLARIKLTWAPSPKHIVSLSASADPAFISNIDQTNYQLGVAEDKQNQGGVFAIARWDYLRSKNINTSVSLGFQYNHLDDGPQGLLGKFTNNNDGTYSAINNTYDPSRPQHTNSDDGTVWYQGGQISYDKRYTVQFDPSLSLRGKWLGHHDAKFGIQSRFEYHSAYVAIPGNTSYNDAGGGPLESGLCDPTTGNGCNQRTDQNPFNSHQWGVGVGAFAQDRWKPFSRLTILPGFRFDYGQTRNTLGQTVSSLFGFGPRLAATFALTRDQRTIFSAAYGRSNETLSLLATGSADVSALATTYQFDPAKKSWDLLHTSGGADGYKLDPKAKTPHSDEVVLSLRREVLRGSVAGVTYTYKRVSNIWDGVEVNQIWNPAGTNVIGYANGMPQTVYKYTTPDDNYRIYQGIDFEYEARPNDHLDFYAAYTLSWLYGPGAEELGLISPTGFEPGYSQYYNPRQKALFDGFLPEDVRHNLKLRVSYTWHGLTGGAFFNYFSGAPLTKLFYNPYDADYTYRRSPQGTDPGTGNTPNQVAEFRKPDQVVVNLRVSYDFSEMIHQHVLLIADVFNLFNLNAATGVENRDIPTFGGVTTRQQPFRFQLGLRYVY